MVDYILHGKVLKSVDHAKYLGVTFTSDFRWNKHVSNTTKKANQVLGVLRRNLKIQSKPLKATAYKSLVRPIFEYASTVWDPFTQKETNSLEMVQRRAARYALGRYDRLSSVTDMLKELKWESLKLRRERRRIEMLYKMNNNLVEINKHNLLPKTSRSRHTNSLAFLIPRSATEYHRNSFFPRTIKRWNSLPEETVTVNSLTAFKSELDKLLQ